MKPIKQNFKAIPTEFRQKNYQIITDVTYLNDGQKMTYTFSYTDYRDAFVSFKKQLDRALFNTFNLDKKTVVGFYEYDESGYKLLKQINLESIA